MKKIIPLILIATVLLGITSCKNEVSVHTVTFKTKTADKVEAQLVQDGQCAKDPEVSFMREGFSFDGWTLDGDMYDFSTPVTKDIVLVAAWNVRCTVSFLDENGEKAICDLQEVDYMSTITEPENPSKAGYTFAFWIAPDGSRYNFRRPVYMSMELKASWIPNEYTVSYNANGASINEDGALPETATYTYGENFTVAGISTSKLSKPGYVFEGWILYPEDENADVYKPGESKAVEPGNMVLYAKWTAKTYNLGDTGPSGGIIVAVNSDTSGSWKYIEAAPDSLKGSYPYGYLRDEVITNTRVWTSDELGDGKANTERIVGLFGDEAPIEENSRSQTGTEEGQTYTQYYNIKGTYAAKACYDYSMEYGSVTYDDWYLPNKAEMDSFYNAFLLSHRTGRGVDTGEYATSSEVSKTECTSFVFVTQPVTDLNISGLYIRKYESQTVAKSKTLAVWPVRYI